MLLLIQNYSCVILRNALRTMLANNSSQLCCHAGEIFSYEMYWIW